LRPKVVLAKGGRGSWLGAFFWISKFQHAAR
jgi:hypothetical protein